MNDMDLNELTNDGMKTNASCAASVGNEQHRAIMAPLGRLRNYIVKCEDGRNSTSGMSTTKTDMTVNFTSTNISRVSLHKITAQKALKHYTKLITRE